MTQSSSAEEPNDLAGLLSSEYPGTTDSIAGDERNDGELSPSQARALFISHFLSTWNARTYEFAAILLTATAFPDTLTMSSLRGLIITLAALLSSSYIGTAIDSSRTRLGPLIMSITVNRCSIMLGCTAWYALFTVGFELEEGAKEYYTTTRISLFGLAMALGVIEKLSGIANMVSSERDWVPTMADDQGQYTLTTLNAVMRRIDLICKLVAPIVISWIISMSTVRIGIVTIGGLSALSCSFEIINALAVWRSNSRLREPKSAALAQDQRLDKSVRQKLEAALVGQVDNIRFFFSTSVWVPSLALALLYFSALSYAATLTTYLLNTGFSLIAVTLARAAGSIVEVSSTWVAPFGIRRLATSKIRASNEDSDYASESGADQDCDPTSPQQANFHAVGLQRSGLWGITLQWACLVPVVVSLWQLDVMREQPSPSSDPIGRLIRGLSPSLSWVLTSAVLFASLSLSRMGLWVFDLAVQEMTQTAIDPSRRSAFGGTEVSFINFFELSQWIAALCFAKVEQFRWLALASFLAVTCSWLAYALWVRRQRGHLVHLEHLALRCGLRSKHCQHAYHTGPIGTTNT